MSRTVVLRLSLRNLRRRFLKMDRAGSLEADARIDQRKDDVGQDVADQHQHAANDQNAERHRVVTLQNRGVPR